MRVIDLRHGESTGEVLEWVKFSGASCGWRLLLQPLSCARRLGIQRGEHLPQRLLPQGGDASVGGRLVFRNDDEPNRYHFAGATRTEYVVLNTSTGTDGNSLHVMSLEEDADWKPIVDGFQHHSSMVEHVNGKLYILTDIDAPRYRLVAADPTDPSNMTLWQDILPESEDLLESVSVVGGQLWAIYLHNASNRVMRCDLDGTNPRVVSLPAEVGSVGGFGGKMSAKELYYAFTSFTQPTSIYKMDIASGESTLWSMPDVAFDPSEFEARQEWYTSKDGTRVPMFIIHKKGLEKDGANPTFLYAYGGFNISLTPSFSASNIAFLSVAGFMPCPTCAAEGSSAKPGTKPACCSTSKTCLTISSRRRSPRGRRVHVA